MEAYKYHCHSVLSPRGGTTAGNSSAASVHGSFNSLNVTSGESLHCDEDDTRKWRNFFMPLVFSSVRRRSVQVYVGTMVLPLRTTIAEKSCSQPTDHNVGAFATISCLVCQETDLARQSFARYTKYCALPWRKEVDGARLKWIGGIAYLLCIVK